MDNSSNMEWREIKENKTLKRIHAPRELDSRKGLRGHRKLWVRRDEGVKQTGTPSKEPGGTRIFPPNAAKHRSPTPRLNSTQPKPERGVWTKPSPPSSSPWGCRAVPRRCLGSPGNGSGNIPISSANTFQHRPPLLPWGWVPGPRAGGELLRRFHTGDREQFLDLYQHLS